MIRMIADSDDGYLYLSSITIILNITINFWW